MNPQKSALNSRWSHLKEVLVITSVSWVPLSFGKALRKLLYRTIFARFGKGIHIKPLVEFVNADCIELGNGVRIDSYVRIRNVDKSGRVCLGDGVFLHRGVDIKVHSGGNGRFEIGDYTTIGLYSCLSGRDIKIGKYCLLAPHVGIFANNHIFDDPTRPIRHQGNSYKGVAIEDNCWLGCGVKVMDGVTIGEGSVIGAGAVVTKDIPPYSIAVGVPAKVVSKRKGIDDNSAIAEAERMMQYT